MCSCNPKYFLFILLGLAFLQMGHSQRDLQNRLGVLFFICINVVISTLSPYLHIFADDRKRIIKERASDCYRGYVAYLAKIFSDWPALLIVNLTYHTALYWTIGLQTGSGNYFFFILIILVLVVFCTGIFIDNQCCISECASCKRCRSHFLNYIRHIWWKFS